MKSVFVFDLDSTITKCELLPLIAECVGLGPEMARLTERAMRGEIPFERSFLKRVELLKAVPVSRAREITADAPLNGEIAAFIRENRQRCRILTGNLDVWIAPILEKLGMEGLCLCSRASVCEDRLDDVRFVLDKAAACSEMPRPFVAIGDGSNDIGMLKAADMGVAFGGVRRPPDELAAAADRIAANETELVEILRKLL